MSPPGHETGAYSTGNADHHVAQTVPRTARYPEIVLPPPLGRGGGDLRRQSVPAMVSICPHDRPWVSGLGTKGTVKSCVSVLERLSLPRGAGQGEFSPHHLMACTIDTVLFSSLAINTVNVRRVEFALSGLPVHDMTCACSVPYKSAHLTDRRIFFGSLRQDYLLCTRASGEFHIRRYF